jgi:hypothetical protein
MPATARRESPYAHAIRPLLERFGHVAMDPRHVEAFMRLEHSTLDGLAAWQFAEEVRTAAECVAFSTLGDAEELAQSFGF